MRLGALILLPLCGMSAFAPAQAPGHFASGSATVTQAALSDAMGACVLRRNRSAAIAVAVASNGAAEKSAVDRIHGDMVACLASRPSATLSGLYVRSAIAERLLTEEGAALLGRVAALTPVAPVRVAPGEEAGQTALACAVRADPGDAAAMLRAPAATPDEAAAFRKLAPALQSCVPATGAVSIKSYVVRATVAIEAVKALHAVMTISSADAGGGLSIFKGQFDRVGAGVSAGATLLPSGKRPPAQEAAA